jgi:transcriptional regulator with XRE-family HTH domain
VDEPVDIDALKDLVRAHRKRLGLSLRAAAAQVEVPPNTLARVESGHLPDLANFRRLVNWLGLDPERFFRPDRVRAEPTVEVIAHHLAKDPHLTPSAAEQIGNLVKQLYESLATRDIATGVHLRAASTFTPSVAALLGEALEDMQKALEQRSATGQDKRPS